MGRDHYLHVESHTSAGWSIPAGFYVPPPGAPAMPRRDSRDFSASIGEFAWINGRSYSAQADLFWGGHALFPMRDGLPEDFRRSPFFEYLFANGEEGFEDYQLTWIPYEELLIDDWQGLQVSVRGSIDFRLATLFEDGRQAFPREPLLQAGADVDRLRLAPSLCDEPVDWTDGRKRYELSLIPPQARQDVAVTWTSTVVEVLGDELVEQFIGLRRFAPDPALRILATFC